jgi:hypothetical protein
MGLTGAALRTRLRPAVLPAWRNPPVHLGISPPPSSFLSATRVPTPSPRTPPWAGMGVHALNRGGKGVRNPVDAL